MLFDRERLKKLIIPIVIEQLLAITVGMVDMVMVSHVGEAAVSGVSLIDTMSNLLICLFSALATGGAVVCAQYIGKQDKKKATVAANQLVLVMGGISFGIMLICLLFYRQIIGVVYGEIKWDIRQNAEVYFLVIAASMPFLALYNGCSALFRSMGNTKVSMKISFAMNLINVMGNAIFIYIFNMGTLGVGLATFISRVIGAVIIVNMLRNQDLPVSIHPRFRLGFDFSIIKKILYIGIPTGLENSMFQIGKLLLASLVSTFGSVEIAGNAVANGITNFGVIPGNAIGLALVTVVGQCIGANDSEQAYQNTRKLLKTSYIAMIVVNILIAIMSSPLIALYDMSDAVNLVAQRIIVCHSIASCVIWPLSFILPHALRAANDVKYTMKVSIFSMWAFRICFGVLLAKYLGLKALGVWFAMFIDWTFRGIMFGLRFFKRKLKQEN